MHIRENPVDNISLFTTSNRNKIVCMDYFDYSYKISFQQIFLLLTGTALRPSVVLLLVLLLQFFFCRQTVIWHRAQYLPQILLLLSAPLHYIVGSFVDNLLSESDHNTKNSTINIYIYTHIQTYRYYIYIYIYIYSQF